jgi:pilus assembly protein CpaB
LSNRMKSFLVILVGLFLVAVGVVVSILLYQRMYGTTQLATNQEDVVKTQVVVVTRDLYLGDQLKVEDVKVVNLPVEFAPRDAVGKIEEVVGKFIKTDLVTGEMVLAHNLANPTNSNHDLSFILSDDHVLMAFPADDSMSWNNLVQRGDIVDIFATFNATIQTVPDTTTATTSTTGIVEEPVERTFTVNTFQKVSITALVLGVVDQESIPTLQGEDGPQAKINSTKINSYLLALNPQDALVLKHLKDTDAVFDIVLRAPTSTVQFELTPVTEEYIIEFYGLEILP